MSNPNKIDPEQRFWPKVDKTKDCWIWIGQIHRSGYGVFWDGSKYVRSHRYRFIADNGYAPEVVMHSCDTPACVRPEHLTGGTQLDNIRDRDNKGRGKARNPTHCKRGHPFSDDNVYLTKQNRRVCRVCQRIREKESYNRKKA